MCGALAIELALPVEHRAGEIEPLLDVHRVGGVLAAPTPICSAIDMKRLLNISSITGSTLRADRRASRRSGTMRVSTGGRASVISAASRARPRWSPPALTIIAGPATRVAGTQRRAVVDRRLDASAGHMRLTAVPRGAASVVDGATSVRGSLDRWPRPDHLDRQRLDHQRLFRHDEAVTLAVRLLESRRPSPACRIDVDDQRGIGALVA